MKFAWAGLAAMMLGMAAPMGAMGATPIGGMAAAPALAAATPGTIGGGIWLAICAYVMNEMDGDMKVSTCITN